jgi:acetate---CoA ligase (ADP-forming)
VVAALRDRVRQANGPLDEHASKNLLAAYGLLVTREYLVTSVEAAVQAAENLGYPVVLKTVAPLMPLMNKLLAWKRSIIETIFH